MKKLSLLMCILLVVSTIGVMPLATMADADSSIVFSEPWSKWTTKVGTYTKGGVVYDEAESFDTSGSELIMKRGVWVGATVSEPMISYECEKPVVFETGKKYLFSVKENFSTTKSVPSSLGLMTDGINESSHHWIKTYIEIPKADPNDETPDEDAGKFAIFVRTPSTNETVRAKNAEGETYVHDDIFDKDTYNSLNVIFDYTAYTEANPVVKVTYMMNDVVLYAYDDGELKSEFEFKDCNNILSSIMITDNPTSESTTKLADLYIKDITNIKGENTASLVSSSNVVAPNAPIDFKFSVPISWDKLKATVTYNGASYTNFTLTPKYTGATIVINDNIEGKFDVTFSGEAINGMDFAADKNTVSFNARDEYIFSENNGVFTMSVSSGDDITTSIANAPHKQDAGDTSVLWHGTASRAYTKTMGYNNFSSFIINSNYAQKYKYTIFESDMYFANETQGMLARTSCYMNDSSTPVMANTVVIVAGETIPAGEWHKIAAVYHDEICEIYIDGKLYKTVNTTKGIHLKSFQLAPIVASGEVYDAYLDNIKMYGTNVNYEYSVEKAVIDSFKDSSYVMNADSTVNTDYRKTVGEVISDINAPSAESIFVTRGAEIITDTALKIAEDDKIVLKSKDGNLTYYAIKTPSAPKNKLYKTLTGTITPKTLDTSCGLQYEYGAHAPQKADSDVAYHFFGTPADEVSLTTPGHGKAYIPTNAGTAIAKADFDRVIIAFDFFLGYERNGLFFRFAQLDENKATFGTKYNIYFANEANIASTDPGAVNVNVEPGKWYNAAIVVGADGAEGNNMCKVYLNNEQVNEFEMADGLHSISDVPSWIMVYAPKGSMYEAYLDNIKVLAGNADYDAGELGKILSVGPKFALDNNTISYKEDATIGEFVKYAKLSDGATVVGYSDYQTPLADGDSISDCIYLAVKSESSNLVNYYNVEAIKYFDKVDLEGTINYSEGNTGYMTNEDGNICVNIPLETGVESYNLTFAKPIKVDDKDVYSLSYTFTLKGEQTTNTYMQLLPFIDKSIINMFGLGIHTDNRLVYGTWNSTSDPTTGKCLNGYKWEIDRPYRFTNVIDKNKNKVSCYVDGVFIGEYTGTGTIFPKEKITGIRISGRSNSSETTFNFSNFTITDGYGELYVKNPQVVDGKLFGTIVNASGIEKNINVVAASYDTNGKLLGTKIYPVPLTGETYQLDNDFAASQNDAYYKVFITDADSIAKPLAKPAKVVK